MTDQAFFQPAGNEFLSSEQTRGPWSAEHQHGGPPSALLTRAMEQLTELQIVRVTVELIAPVPIAPLELRAEVIRPGKRVQIIDATLHAEDRLVCRARAVAVRRTNLDFGEIPPAEVPSLPSPGDCAPATFPFFANPIGYHTATEQRFARGNWGQREASLWMRSRCPLVAGEAMTPLQRVMVVADCNNGVANVLDKDRFVFINPDLSVHLYRAPVSEWVCLHAVTHPQPSGYGIAESLLLDEEGLIGRSVQTLFIDERR